MLIVVLLQIDRAVSAEGRDGVASSRVERDEAIAGRDVENPLLASVGPEREPAPGQLARRDRAAFTFLLAVHPQQLAGAGIERDHGAPGSGGREDDAARHQRRPLVLILGTRAEAVGLEAP